MLNTVELINAFRELQNDSNPIHFEDALTKFVNDLNIKPYDDLELFELCLSNLKNGNREQRRKALTTIGDNVDVYIYGEDEDYDYDLSWS